MGDRGNIVVRFPGKKTYRDIYLYTHWGGSDIGKTLRAALASKEGRARWGDESHLCRIILNHLQGDDRGETGYGISPFETDNEHPILVCDTRDQTVYVLGKKKDKQTFAEFVGGS